MGAASVVTAFLSPGLHMIVYPLRGGSASTSRRSRRAPTAEDLERAPTRGCSASDVDAPRPALAGLQRTRRNWTAWPIHTVDPAAALDERRGPRADRRCRACDDAFCGAGCGNGDRGCGDARRPRRRAPERLARRSPHGRRSGGRASRRVARRGALNRLAWHASGPVALARNLFLKMRSPQKLAADLDWLYGWEPVPPDERRIGTE